MCIRDSAYTQQFAIQQVNVALTIRNWIIGFYIVEYEQHGSCLLYTSDAADERSSVDLGGRRIIKKKKNI